MQSKMNILKTKSFNSKSHALSDYQNVTRAESSIKFQIKKFLNGRNCAFYCWSLKDKLRQLFNSSHRFCFVVEMILRFGEEKGRERGICCFICGLILICVYSRESLAKLLINTKINQFSERGLQFQADLKLSLY